MLWSSTYKKVRERAFKESKRINAVMEEAVEKHLGVKRKPAYLYKRVRADTVKGKDYERYSKSLQDAIMHRLGKGEVAGGALSAWGAWAKKQGAPKP